MDRLSLKLSANHERDWCLMPCSRGEWRRRKRRRRRSGIYCYVDGPLFPSFPTLLHLYDISTLRQVYLMFQVQPWRLNVLKRDPAFHLT